MPWKPDFKDTDLTQLAEAVSAQTGRSFLIDSAHQGIGHACLRGADVPGASYSAFLSVLKKLGFKAETHADPIWTVPCPTELSGTGGP